MTKSRAQKIFNTTSVIVSFVREKELPCSWLCNGVIKRQVIFGPTQLQGTQVE